MALKPTEASLGRGARTEQFHPTCKDREGPEWDKWGTDWEALRSQQMVGFLQRRNGMLEGCGLGGEGERHWPGRQGPSDPNPLGDWETCTLVQMCTGRQ